jgi:hypothetical protein
VTKDVFSQPSNQSKPALGPSKVNNKIFLGSQKGASHLTFFCFCWFLFPFLPLPGIGDSELDALGVGNIDVIVEVDQITTFRTLTEVLYVPGLGSNLFSVSAATTSGLIVTFDDNKVSSSLILLRSPTFVDVHTPTDFPDSLLVSLILMFTLCLICLIRRNSKPSLCLIRL